MPDSPYFLDTAAPALHRCIEELLTKHMVFFAGMPGTGKSLLTHQLTHLAVANGRHVHLLQWDVSRPVFEAHETAQDYPRTNGVTHPLVRIANGLWARAMLASWGSKHDARDFLIGETPLIGNRFTELVRVQHDAAEFVLRSPDCRFVLVLPSNDVESHVLGERARRYDAPVNPHELEDAPPHLIRSSWVDLYTDARKLGVAVAPELLTDGRYDRDTYRAIYERLLRHRNLDVLPVDVVLPTSTMSVYDLDVPVERIVPDATEVALYMLAAESLGAAAVERWWEV